MISFQLTKKFSTFTTSNKPEVSTIALGKNKYMLLGKLLMAHKPDVAQELLSSHESNNIIPQETDHARLDKFFISFCRIRQIDPENYIHADRQVRRINEQRFFLAAMLHLYYPQLSNGYMQRLEPRSGFVKYMSGLLRQDKGNVSKMIREVLTLEKVYQDFQETVQQILQQLQEK